MKPIARLADRWRNVPAVAALLAVLLLLTGLGVIALSERNYRAQALDEARVQAAILAESVVAAVDFGDPLAAQEAVNALRVNRQVRSAAVHGPGGRLIAGFEQPDRRLASVMAVDAPVMRDGDRIGLVRMTFASEPWQRRLARYALIGLFVVMAALVAAVLGIAHTALRRVNRQLEERAHALADANRELELQMRERAKAEEQLRQAQKMQALGQLTGGIAHDFNNLLTVIQGSADILRRATLDDAKRIRFAEAIVETSGRAAALTNQLLAFARRQPLQPKVFDLSSQIGAMADLLNRTLGERIDVVTDLCATSCHVEADPAQLESAVLNIAVNAKDAMPEGGTLTIRTGPAAPIEGARPAYALSISDTGAGIEPEALARVFEPFFTTKAVGKGTGLGLSQVYGFAKQSGGDVRLESTRGQGTTVTILLPCVEADADAPAAAAPPDAPHETGRVLLVDDNETVGAFAETMLRELGHEVVRARSGGEAIALAQEQRFDVVFTDVVMPEMSGLQLAERLRALRPNVPVVLTTGYSDELAQSGAHGLPVVFKPYRLETIAAALDRALTAPTG